MYAHSCRSRHRGPGVVVCAFERASRISGRLETTAHIPSHARPVNLVNQNAARHPHRRKIGVTTSGVTTAPSDPPLKATARPRPRRSSGSVCTTVRSPPGNVAPSPKPSAARAAAKLHKPPAKACATEAPVQNRTPHRIGHAVRNREGRDDETVLLAGETRLTQDGGRQKSQRIAVDIADQRDRQHCPSRRPARDSPVLLQRHKRR